MVGAKYSLALADPFFPIVAIPVPFSVRDSLGWFLCFSNLFVDSCGALPCFGNLHDQGLGPKAQ